MHSYEFRSRNEFQKFNRNRKHMPYMQQFLMYFNDNGIGNDSDNDNDNHNDNDIGNDSDNDNANARVNPARYLFLPWRGAHTIKYLNHFPQNALALVCSAFIFSTEYVGVLARVQTWSPT